MSLKSAYTMESKATILFLLFFFIAKSNAQEVCLEKCEDDPCSNLTCPRFLNADCRPNLCLCTADFFWKGSNVTDRCPVETCAEKVCNPKRKCVETVFPPECPPMQPKCRQYIKAKCMLVPPIMSCSEINCGEGMGCRFRARPIAELPPVVRCLPLNRLNTCFHGTCDHGLTCIDDGPSIRCEQIKQTCSEIKCGRGKGCILRPGPNNLHVFNCVPLRRLFNCYPGTCDEGFTCIDDGPSISCEPTSRPTTLPSTTLPSTAPPSTTLPSTPPSSTVCSQVDIDSCLAQFQSCKLLEDGNSECVPFASCSELSCPTGFECVMDKEIEPICILSSKCSILQPFCESFDLTCESIEGVGLCVSPNNCSEIECIEGYTCVDLSFNNSQSGICVEDTNIQYARTCEELNCTYCILTYLPSISNSSIAVCADNDTDELIASTFGGCSLEGTCPDTPGATCLDLVDKGTNVLHFCTAFGCTTDDDCSPFNDTFCIKNVTSFADSVCAPVDTNIFYGVSCESNKCVGNESCLEVNLGKELIASICTPDLFIDVFTSCTQLKCDVDGEVCSETIIVSDLIQNISLATCINEEEYLQSLEFLL